MSYEPKVTVVRRNAYTEAWMPEDGEHLDQPRAYLVEGCPMPGERVVFPSDRVEVVTGVVVRVVTNGGRANEEHWRPRDLRPYDPDEALVEEALGRAQLSAKPFDGAVRDAIRYAIAAMREADQ